jgi:RHH-type proline utilization regulon transcriptional repressor/proline dehydrogenase/delta 1-pyrroline-5-carboxylate dehydrogenase
MQSFAALAAGNAVALLDGDAARCIVAALHAAGLEPELAALVDPDEFAERRGHDGQHDSHSTITSLLSRFPQLAVVVFDGAADVATSLRRALAARDGRRVLLLRIANDLPMFATERVVSIDTTASGGNATLLTLDED